MRNPVKKESEKDAVKTIDPHLSAHDQAVRLMATWISAIADQVRNPVAGLSAAATLIEKQMFAFRSAKEWDPAIVEEAVRLMLERLSRFDNYLTELSGFTRPLTIEPKWLDFSKEWIAIEKAIFRRIPLQFQLKIEVGSVVQIYADPERLHSALIAVVLNSVEACGTAIEPEILISFSVEEAPTSDLKVAMIRVYDNGPGFSESALVQGLIPFFTTKDAGTGLGLAMVEKYLRAHGGSVRIANHLESGHVQGAVVELSFPYPFPEA